MKRFFLTLLILSVSAPASASPVIRFSAAVESEALAEEVILLLHCVASRKGLPWEFSGDAGGSHWLSATEAKGTAQVVWHSPDGEARHELATGGSEEACDRLAPAAKAASPFAVKDEPALASVGGTLVDDDEEPSRTWLWVGLGAAAVAGFLFWKSRQPDHRGVELR